MPDERQSSVTPSLKESHWLSPSQALTAEFIGEDTQGLDQHDNVDQSHQIKHQFIDRYGIIICETGFAIPAMNYCQIERITFINKLLNAPDWVKGQANIGGNIVPVFDLAVLFGLSQVATYEPDYTLLVGNSDEAVGILIDKLPSRKIFYSEQKFPPPPIPESLMPFVPCCYITDDSTVDDIQIDTLKMDHSIVAHHKKDKIIADNNFWLELDIDKLLTTLAG